MSGMRSGTENDEDSPTLLHPPFQGGRPNPFGSSMAGPGPTATAPSSAMWPMPQAPPPGMEHMMLPLTQNAVMPEQAPVAAAGASTAENEQNAQQRGELSVPADTSVKTRELWTLTDELRLLQVAEAFQFSRRDFAGWDAVHTIYNNEWSPARTERALHDRCRSLYAERETVSSLERKLLALQRANVLDDRQGQYSKSGAKLPWTVSEHQKLLRVLSYYRDLTRGQRLLGYTTEGFMISKNAQGIQWRPDTGTT